MKLLGSPFRSYLLADFNQRYINKLNIIMVVFMIDLYKKYPEHCQPLFTTYRIKIYTEFNLPAKNGEILGIKY